MIYRSRYLDRMLFSPLGYRHDARALHARRTRSRAQAQAYPQPRSEEPVSHHYHDAQLDCQQGYQPPLPQSCAYQPQAGHHLGHLGERAAHLPSRELRLIVGRCEEIIRGGRAQIEDYEAFVICQQELSNRA